MSSTAAKPPEYFTQSRDDLVSLLHRPLGNVLDVGCGAGEVGAGIRADATRLTGIELEPGPAAAAAQYYDDVLVGGVMDVLPALSGPFDTLLCYDVLEHLPDAMAPLRALRALASPQAQLHISVPNARHGSLIRDLVFRGTFGYTSMGHRDNTHLRWYTRRDLITLLARSGWHPESVHGSLVGRSRVLNRVSGGLLREFTVLQWQILARPG